MRAAGPPEAQSAPLILGIDTGGTFTDAVLVAAERRAEGPGAIVASAKRPTTHGALADGIAAVLGAVLAEGIDPARIRLVALSTTLATNALVEGAADPAGLVLIGFAERDLGRHGLADALGRDPLIRIAGGHDALGSEAAPLDAAALGAALEGLVAEGQCPDAFAVAGLFSVRNPAHEDAAGRLIRAATGQPTTLSHHLSARVGGPQRAVTALLNARLTGVIATLLRAMHALMAETGIAAPLMVVRGDGSLVADAFAAERPVETILSGPAASLTGAGWLSGVGEAVVADIGGTTTDIGLLRGGRPRIDPAGATVGGFRTMVEAVAMTTHGIGGDSEIRPAGRDDGAPLAIGPRRVIPIARLADRAPALVRTTLGRQAGEARISERVAGFATAVAGARGRDAEESRLLEILAAGPIALDRSPEGGRARAAFDRLRARGAIRLAGVTPTDAAHALGLQTGGDADASRHALGLLARLRRPDGSALATDGTALAQAILAVLADRSAEAVLATLLAEDGFPASAATHAVLRAALAGHSGCLAPRLGIRLPLIALGASAATHYPEIARRLDMALTVPGHAGVANAVGAAVAPVRLRRSGTVTVPSPGRYRAHLPDAPRDFADPDTAAGALATALQAALLDEGRAAGATFPVVEVSEERAESLIEGQRMVVEIRVTATLTARPRLAALAEPADRGHPSDP
ncbi:MAG: hydantoinase/oxoprolinase N-terminal domain-containing protein [Paracoccaceae bacterium]